MEKATQGYVFGWITRLLPLLFMEFPKPKTSWKTSCFFLNDAMFWRCFWKNINVDVFDDVLKNAKHRANNASNDVNRPPLARGDVPKKKHTISIPYQVYSRVQVLNQCSKWLHNPPSSTRFKSMCFTINLFTKPFSNERIYLLYNSTHEMK